MTRPKAIIVVTIAALIFAAIAVWQVSEYLKKQKPGETQNVVVATAELAVGSNIKDAAQLKTVGWPKESVPPDSFSDPRAVMGRVTVRPVSPGEPITESKLLPVGATSVMTYVIPPGHRAITVGVNEVAGVAGFLNPNNRVDVVLTTTPPHTTEPISKIVLQNVPVLAIGQIMEHKEGKPVVVPTVTLDLTPEDAEKIAVAASKGSLQLLLRNATDTGVVESRGANIIKVLGAVPSPVTATMKKAGAVKKPAKKTAEAKTPVEAKMPAGAKGVSPYSVEVIRGTSKKTEQLNMTEENK